MADARISLGLDDQTAAGFNTVDRRAEASAKKAKKEWAGVSGEMRKLGPAGAAAFNQAEGVSKLKMATMALGVMALRSAFQALGEEFKASMQAGANHAKGLLEAAAAVEKMVSNARATGRKTADSVLGGLGDPMRAVVARMGDAGVDRSREMAKETGAELKEILGLVAGGFDAGHSDPYVDAVVRGGHRLAELGMGSAVDHTKQAFGLTPDTLRELLGDDPSSLNPNDLGRRLLLGGRFAASRSPEAEQERQDLLRARQDDWWARRQQIKDKLDRDMMFGTVADRQSELSRRMPLDELEDLRAPGVPTLDELDTDGRVGFEMFRNSHFVGQSRYMSAADERRRLRAETADIGVSHVLRHGANDARLDLGKALAEFEAPGITAAVEALRAADRETALAQAESEYWGGQISSKVPTMFGPLSTYNEWRGAERQYREASAKQGRLADAVQDIIGSERAVPVRIVGGGSPQLGE